MKLADKIKFDLLVTERTSPYDIMIPNFYVGRYEMDVFKLMQSGYIVEYEIKISRSDFFADLKKGTKEGRVGKHELMSKGESQCNRFYFVTPKDLIKPDEVPAHAGLIYHHGNMDSCVVVKNAPLLHKRKREADVYRYLAFKLAFRCFNIEKQRWIAKRIIE